MLVADLAARLKVGPVHIGDISIYLEYRRCGKECRTCRFDYRGHGPYIYARFRDRRRRYLGSLRNTERLQARLDQL